MLYYISHGRPHAHSTILQAAERVAARNNSPSMRARACATNLSRMIMVDLIDHAPASVALRWGKVFAGNVHGAACGHAFVLNGVCVKESLSIRTMH